MSQVNSLNCWYTVPDTIEVPSSLKPAKNESFTQTIFAGNTQILFGPFQLIIAIKDFLYAVTRDDTDELSQLAAKITTTTLSFVEALQKYLLIGNNFIAFLASQVVSKKGCLIGIFISCIEGWIQYKRTKAQVGFHQSLLSTRFSWINQSDSSKERIERSLKKHQTALEQAFGLPAYSEMTNTLERGDIQTFKEKFTNSVCTRDLFVLFNQYITVDNPKAGIRKLCERIEPFKAKEFLEQLPQIHEQLRSPDQALQKKGFDQAKALMESITIQSKKKLIIHFIAITSIALGLIAFTGLMLSTPMIFGPFLLFSTFFSILEYIFANGLLRSEKWGFSLLGFIPSYLIRAFQNKPCSDTVKA